MSSKSNFKLSKICAAAIFAASFSSAALAYSDVNVYDSTGRHAFTMRFLDAGDSYDEGGKTIVADWSYNDTQKSVVAAAAKLYAEIFASNGSAQTEPVVVRVVGKVDSDDPTNAFAGALGFDTVTCGGDECKKAWTTKLINGENITSEDYEGLAAHVTVNTDTDKVVLYELSTSLSPLPGPETIEKSNNSLLITIFHELGHAMGIGSSASTGQNMTVGELSLFDIGLRDVNGKWLKDYQDTKFNVTSKEDAAANNQFYVGPGQDSGVTFHGTNVDEVTEGAGVPINGYEKGPNGIIIELSHSELEHSLMSHQSYRNYAFFMEAELALLQDIGYNIDRSKFYGHTVFGDGLNYAGDTAWSSDATLAVGLHVYGKNNTVVQNADLSANGIASTGIRVDGTANKLTISEGATIAGNGTNGAGLLVAYGKDHEITSNGDIIATGSNGVAAWFDFGNNMLGNYVEYRGSYIRTQKNENVSVTSDGLNLNGPLVKFFNVSGALSGEEEAIYISNNAFVKNVNILTANSDAAKTIKGDIISDWDINNELIQYAGDRTDLLTNLTFGAGAVDADGTANGSDDAFERTLQGSILGANSVAMSVLGGTLTITGDTNVYSLSNLNNSYLALGDSGAEVTTSFTNDAGSTLEVAFAGMKGASGVLASSANIADGSKYALRPVAGYYPNETAISADPSAIVTLRSGASGGTFTSFVGFNMSALPASPTIASYTTDNAAGTITAHRYADAYSRYALSETGANVGAALYGISVDAKSDMWDLFTALDFSAADGSQIGGALSQLSPETYDLATKSTLNHQNELNVMLARHLLSQTGEISNLNNAGDWQVWASPYAYHRNYSASDEPRHESTRYGVLAGAERAGEDGLNLGFHFDVSHEYAYAKDKHNDKIKTNAGFVGLHGNFKPSGWSGAYVMGEARVGAENVKVERDISFNGYHKEPNGSYTAPVFGALFGGGWDFSGLDGDVAAGPVAWLEYAATHRPKFSEEEGDGANLELESKTYQSVKSALGARVSARVPNATGVGLRLDALAAWRHELTNSKLTTDAHFKNYGGYGFNSSTKRGDKDSLLLGVGASLDYGDGVFVQGNLGGEVFGKRTTFNAGVSVGWRF